MLRAFPPAVLAASPARSPARPEAQAEQALRPESQLPFAPSAPPPDPAATFEPSAPPAAEADGLASAPPAPVVDEAEVLRQAVQEFLESASARDLLNNVAAQILGTSLAPSLRQAHRALLRVRAEEEAALQYQSQRAAVAAARAAVDNETKKAHDMIKTSASEMITQEIAGQVPQAVAQSPLVQELLREHRSRVAREAKNAAASEFTEIHNEEKYHRVKNAFLKTLEERSNKTIHKIAGNSMITLDGMDARADKASGEMSSRVQKAGALPLFLSVAALAGSVLSIAAPMSRL